MKKHKQLNSKDKKPTVSPAYEVYLNSLAIGGRKGMISMLGQASRILGWKKAPGYYPWHELSYQKLHLVRASMLEQEYSINSVNLCLAALRGVSRAAFNLEMMSSEQLMRIGAVQSVRGDILRKGRSLSETDIRALLQACSKDKTKTMAARDRAILLLGCGAGLRSSELISLKVGGVDFVEAKIKVLGKGRKERVIALAKPVIKALAEWVAMLPDKDGFLFRQVLKGGSVRKNGLSKQGVTKILQNLQQSSGVDKFSPHSMRRSFVTRLLERGNDINTVKILAGHSQITTTARYDFRPMDELTAASRALF